MCLGLNHVNKYSTTELYNTFEVIFLRYILPRMKYLLNYGVTVFKQYSSWLHSRTDKNQDIDIDMKVDMIGY